jgi:GH24 family phage-related lysozyme (muramidase)
MTYSDPTKLMCKPDWFTQSVADLKRHEGFREFAYPDPLSRLGRLYSKEKWGFEPARNILARLGESEGSGHPWTVGYGFTSKVTVDSRMTLQQAERKLEELVQALVPDLNSLIPTWVNMPTFAQTVLVNMDYNMGKEKLSHFAPTLEYFKEGKYAIAGDRLTRSLWYSQTGSRAKELVQRLKTGKIEPEHKVVYA